MMVKTIRPHVQPYVLSIGDGTRHWFYSIDGMSVGDFQFVRTANTVCGLAIEQQYNDKEWVVYAWEQGWDVTCDECRDANPVIERKHQDLRMEAAYNAFKDSDDRRLSWRHSVRAAVHAAERYSL